MFFSVVEHCPPDEQLQLQQDFATKAAIRFI